MKKVFVVLVVLILAGLALGMTKKPPETDIRAQAVKVKEVEQPTKTSEASNSEGNLKLVEVNRKTPEGRVSYEFKVVDTQKKTETSIYKTVADIGSTLTIPYNSWSPDYKQVFVKAISPEGENYYVFRSNGESYADGKKYLAVRDYWDETKTTNTIKEISGWAGNDLLMVYTKAEDGSHGPAYWFVTSSRKFMQVREF